MNNEKENLNSKIKELTSQNEELNNKISSASKNSSTTTTSNSSTSTYSKQATSTVTTNNSYTVYVTNTGEKYHASGCKYLKKSKIAKDKNSAIAEGYTPCSVCNP